MCPSFSLTRCADLMLLSLVLMWSYVSTKWTELNLGLFHKNVDFGVPELDVSIFVFKLLGLDPCLWLFWSSCSNVDFFLIKNEYMKGNVSNFLSCFINNSFTSLVSSTHLMHFISGMEVISSLIFGRVWIYTIDLCVYVHIGAGWAHYDDESNSQSFCLK